MGAGTSLVTLGNEFEESFRRQAIIFPGNHSQSFRPINQHCTQKKAPNQSGLVTHAR